MTFSLVQKAFQVVLGSWNPKSTICPFRARNWLFQAPKTLRFKGEMANFAATNTVKQGKKSQKVPISRVYRGGCGNSGKTRLKSHMKNLPKNSRRQCDAFPRIRHTNINIQPQSALQNLGINQRPPNFDPDDRPLPLPKASFEVNFCLAGYLYLVLHASFLRPSKA